MPDDYKKFEGALAGFLHREKRDSEKHVFCPDAELLAAYHDGTLSPEEIQVARLHVEGCSRCQEVLALLKKTEEAPLVAKPVDKTGSWRAEPLTFPGSATRVASHSGWRWIAPAGAIAASLVLWLAFRQEPSTKLSPGEPIQVAENRQDASAPAVPEPSLAPSNSTPQEAPREAESEPVNKMESSDSAQVASLGPATKKRKVQKPNATSPTGQVSRSNSASPAVEKLSPNADFSAGKRTAPANAAPAPAGNGASAMTAQTLDGMGARLPKQNSTNVSLANSFVIIDTPDASTLWRIGAAGSIEISSDGGSSWRPQISGVAADLNAGSAPLSGVCWVVGGSGTVLLTTDSGATWRQVKSPTATDLAGVLALDSLHATVWNVSNERFQTSDGGVTWNRLGSP